MDELEEDFDYILIATKADSLVEVAEKMLPFLHNRSRVVSMQNGICEDQLAYVVGKERTVGCVVGFGGTMHEPGRVIGMKYRRLKSSSLQSLERGRKTEVDNYNGYIARKGKELGVDTPVNAKLTKMVAEIEQGMRQISPGNFREILNA